MLVDDDPLVRTVVADMLLQLGFDVTQAPDGVEALRLLGGLPRPDLLVTDVLMPSMDGWKLSEQVRQTHPGIPVLYITGYSGEDARPVDRSCVIRKPFDQKSLGRALAKLLLQLP